MHELNEKVKHPYFTGRIKKTKQKYLWEVIAGLKTQSAT